MCYHITEADLSDVKRQMKWCENHKEPVWVYDDGSWACWWQTVVETGDETTCNVVDKVPDEVMFKPKVKEPMVVSTLCPCISCQHIRAFPMKEEHDG